MNGILALADGRTFKGKLFGATGEAAGEVVFNTSMTGYQEIITDPSYCGQMVVMTYPLIGNYGINREDYESDRPYLTGFIIKELSRIHSNWRADEDLESFLKKNGIVGIQGLDTRALTRHIREKGAQQAIISPDTTNVSALVEKAAALPSMEGQDLVQQVTCKAPYDWEEGEWSLADGYSKSRSSSEKKKPLVVAYDFGVKRNILRMLADSGCRVRVVPASMPAPEVLAMKPDGVFLSNGPGDPAAVQYAVDNVKALVGKTPIFGICLGHQILSRALGAKTYKLRFGHHGGNQPVMDHDTRKVEITSQNHGFAVDPKAKGDFDILSTNLNDQTIEGLKHKNHPIFSVQYHPEASPGPKDSAYLFKHFCSLMDANT